LDETVSRSWDGNTSLGPVQREKVAWGNMRPEIELERMQVRVELGLSVAARGYVQLGLGVGLFPNPGVGVELPSVCERPLGNLIPAKQLITLWRRGATPRPQARLFVDYVRDWLRSGDAVGPAEPRGKRPPRGSRAKS
jgi:DNA-binding transcriptional LysR family regulator